MFSFWGRRGAISKFSLDAARVVAADPVCRASFSISRQSENFDEFKDVGVDLFPVDTFSSNVGAIGSLWKVPALRRRLSDYIRANRVEAVIELMPHVWSPLLIPAARAAGARYVSIVHDADPHPGDPTSLVKPLLDMSLRTADRILALSESVAGRLVEKGLVSRDRVTVVFHPDFAFQHARDRRAPSLKAPYRLLFLGRILPYKGLPLFVEAVELLRGRGVPVEAAVYGEGDLGTAGPRLAALGAEVVNRWLSVDEMASALASADAVVLSHMSASQSGVAAAAFGSGTPVVATPVGGLVEQVRDGETGVLSRELTAASLADAIERLVTDQDLYRHIVSQLESGSGERSMKRFIERVVELSVAGPGAR